MAVTDSGKNKKRMTAIALGLSVIVCLFFLGYAFDQKEKAEVLEQKLNDCLVSLETTRLENEKNKLALENALKSLTDAFNEVERERHRADQNEKK